MCDRVESFNSAVKLSKQPALAAMTHIKQRRERGVRRAVTFIQNYFDTWCSYLPRIFFAIFLPPSPHMIWVHFQVERAGKVDENTAAFLYLFSKWRPRSYNSKS